MTKIPRFTEAAILRVWRKHEINLKASFLERLTEPEFISQVVEAAFPDEAQAILESFTLIEILQAIGEATRGVVKQATPAPEAAPKDGEENKSS